jgi:hypothetical protein
MCRNGCHSTRPTRARGAASIFFDLELAALGPRKRLERRPRGRAAAGAMAVGGVRERVCDPIADSTALTLPEKEALARSSVGAHFISPR